MTSVRRSCCCLVAGLLQTAMPPTALAVQTASPPEPSKPVLQWIITLLMVGLCAAILFKNAKRTHQS